MDSNKNNQSVFSGILGALNANSRKKNTINPNSASYSPTQTIPSLDSNGSVEDMQQQFLDWQVTKIAHNLYTRTIYYDTDRISAYQDFRAMDGTPEISAALNILRDECLTRSDRGNILEIYSENSRVKEVLKDLFHNVLSVEYNLRLWIRDLIKYGDYFVMLHVDKEVGIYDFQVLPQEEVHREEGFDGRADSVRFRWETTGDYFEEWQVAHFRLLEDTRKIPYGRSLLDSSRKLWKQLQLAEDAMLVYRITRAPERRVFYIDVGTVSDNEIKSYVGKIQNQVKKQPIVNTRDGSSSYKYNPENVTEDYWIPMRGEKSSRIETLPGASNLSDIEDIEFLQNKLFAALQVPKTYLNYAEGMQGGSTLSQADLRFARTINSIQEAILMELRRVAKIHLYFLGFHDDLDNFTLTLTNPSTQQELLKLETMKARLEVFKEFFSGEATSPASYTWGMEEILGFSKSDIKLILKQKKVEKKIFSEIESAVETYGKIGLFDDLDERYEDPNAVAQAANKEGGDESMGDEGGGFSGGGFGGGMSDIGGGGLDMGDEGEPDIGGEEGGVDTGGEEGAEEGGDEEPLSETKKKSGLRINNLITELFELKKEKDIKEKEKEKVYKNRLFESNMVSTVKTTKLINSIEKSLKINKTSKNMLFESNEKNNETTKEILDKLDEIINENE